MLYLIAKIVKTLFAPANLFCLLLALGAIGAVSHNPRWQIIGRRLCLWLSLILLFVGVFPVGYWALSPLENRYPSARPERVDGIILLGGDECPYITESRRQATVHMSARRYITFAGLAREYPKAKLAFIGGNPEIVSRSKMSNVEVAKPLLKAMGIDADKVIFEDKSQNTYENATLGKEAVKPAKNENWLLVTSAAHMPRALMTFKKAGWNVYAAPTDYFTPKTAPFMLGFNVFRRMNELTMAFYEYEGLLVYWAMGRIDYPWKK